MAEAGELGNDCPNWVINWVLGWEVERRETVGHQSLSSPSRSGREPLRWVPISIPLDQLRVERTWVGEQCPATWARERPFVEPLRWAH